MFLLLIKHPFCLYLLQAVGGNAFGFGYVRESETPPLLKILYFLFFAVILYYLLKIARGITPANHWQHHFDTLHYSSQQFYTTLEQAIREKKMPDITISRVSLYEAGIGSAQREYVRIQRKYLQFDVCAAPFGHGFFISWWQGERYHIVRLIFACLPFIGRYLDRALYPTTYYAIDTEEMFKHSIHTLVLHIVDAITQEKGIRGLTELERNPIAAKR